MLVLLTVGTHFPTRWLLDDLISTAFLFDLFTPEETRLAAMELGTRVALLAMLILARGIFRMLLGQHFGALVRVKDGRWLQLTY